MKKEHQKHPAVSRWLRRGVLIGLAAAACFLIRARQNTSIQLPAPTVSPAPAVQENERSVREAAYDKDVAALEKLLDSGAADGQTQAQAARKLESMIAEHQSETALEEALLQAGFQPVLVLCQNGALTVMVRESLSTEAGASVLGLCMAHTDIAAENIRIMTVER